MTVKPVCDYAWLRAINLKLKQVYIGRDKVCRCGCAGTYHKPSSVIAERAMSRLLDQHTLFPFECSEGLWDEVYINYSYGNDRAICAYFEVMPATAVIIQYSARPTHPAH